jgi:hypothetical protein
MSEFIEILSPSALKDLQTANAEIVTMISNVDKVGAKMKGIATPSGSDSAIKSLTEQYKTQEKVIIGLQNQIGKLIEKQNSNNNSINKNVQTILNQSKSYQDLSKQKAKAISDAEKEQAQLVKSENAYERVKAKINSMLPVYNNLKTKVELGLKLSKSEERQLALTEGRLIKYRETLNKVNKGYGNYSLEVGNYAKGNINLANSIGQISRELPNFGQSFQIGVLSLTNNIGAVIDGIKQVKEQNEILKQQGKQTNSVFSQILSSFFSWQTALFVGIGILSAYSKEIGDFFEKMFTGSKSINSATKSLIEFQKAQAKGNANASNELQIYNEYLKIAGDKSVGYQKQKIAIDYLRSTYGGYLQNLSDEQIMKLKGSKLDKEISSALYYKEKYNANLTEIQQISEKIQVYKQERDARLKYNDDIKKAEYARYNTKGAKETLEAIKAIKYLKRQEELRKEAISDEELKGAVIGDIMLQITAYEEMYNRALQQSVITKEKSLMLENKDSGKAQKDRIDLDYAEIESKYKLRIAKLELLKAQQEEIAENENATDFGRLEARKEFSRLEAEIITANYELETELSKKQFDDENKEAKKKYEENKKNGYNDVRNNLEFAKAKQDILNKYLNDTVTATENRDKQIFDLMIKDAEFAEKIRKVQFEKEEDHRKKTLQAERELALALNKVEQKKFLKFSEDTKRTVKARQLAFLEYKRLALAQLDLEMIIELAKADPEKYDVIRQKYAELRKAIEELITPFQKIQQETEAWINSFKTKPINDFKKALEDAGLASLKMFTDFDEAGETTFSKMTKYAKNTTEQMKVALLAVSEVGQDVFNLISEASNASFKNEYANLEKQKNISLAFAGENEEARAEVERQAEERRKQIARREFQAKKKQAKANIAIDMAQALIALWIKPGFPKAIPMAGVVAGLAIAQMAMVDAQQMPEFWKGTDNAPEGWALTQEKGRELILDKNNNLKSKGNDKGATKTWLNKGDKVIPHEKTMEYLMFNNELNGMLTNNQISEKQPIVNVNSGMSDAQVDRIVSSIKNKSELHIIKDKFGERSYERKQRQTVEIANARVNFKSSAV